MGDKIIEVFRAMLREELQPIKVEISGMKSDIHGMKSEINVMKSEIKEMKSEINVMKSEIHGMKSEINGIKSEIKEIKQDISFIKEQQKEHGELIRILVDKAEVNKAEHDALMHDVAKTSETVNNMRKDLTTVEIVAARNMQNIAHLKAII